MSPWPLISPLKWQRNFVNLGRLYKPITPPVLCFQLEDGTHVVYEQDYDLGGNRLQAELNLLPKFLHRARKLPTVNRNKSLKNGVLIDLPFHGPTSAGYLDRFKRPQLQCRIWWEKKPGRYRAKRFAVHAKNNDLKQGYDGYSIWTGEKRGLPEWSVAGIQNGFETLKGFLEDGKLHTSDPELEPKEEPHDLSWSISEGNASGPPSPILTFDPNEEVAKASAMELAPKKSMDASNKSSSTNSKPSEGSAEEKEEDYAANILFRKYISPFPETREQNFGEDLRWKSAADITTQHHEPQEGNPSPLGPSYPINTEPLPIRKVVKESPRASKLARSFFSMLESERSTALHLPLRRHLVWPGANQNSIANPTSLVAVNKKSKDQAKADAAALRRWKLMMRTRKKMIREAKKKSHETRNGKSYEQRRKR